MVKVFPILAVPSPIPYTTFTCWVRGGESNSVKRLSSLFRSLRSLHCVFRKVRMSLDFFLCVSGAILLIDVATVPIGDGIISS